MGIFTVEFMVRGNYYPEKNQNPTQITLRVDSPGTSEFRIFPTHRFRKMSIKRLIRFIQVIKH